MLKIIRVAHTNKDFIQLVKALNSYLKITDGDEHDFYNQFNNIDVIKHINIAYKNNIAVGCGTFKHYNKNTVEIKRMFTKPEARGLGVAGKILKSLENWSQELGYKHLILETGKKQIEAVSFYKKCNYTITQNFGQYVKMKNSICFKKTLF